MKKQILFIIPFLLITYINLLFGGTMFVSSYEGKTFVGNNEDREEYDSKMWFIPAIDEKYGIVYFGYSNKFALGGMNDQGLVFGSLRTKYLKIKESRGKDFFPGNLIEKVMQECVTVDEVISIFNAYDISGWEKIQFMFVDKTGASVIIEGDKIHLKKGNFQVVTNFYLSQVNENENILCERYKIATKMLKENRTTIESFRNILAATHQEGGFCTQYSNIYDVNSGIIYLYHFHNYCNVVVLNLKEELSKGKHTINIASLFPKIFATISFLSDNAGSLQDIIYKTVENEGVTAGIEQYNSMLKGKEKITAIAEKYETICKEYNVDANTIFNEQVLSQLGRKFLNENKIKEAIEIFKLNAKIHPKSWAVFECLGESYVKEGNRELAIKYYQQSLKINIQNKDIANILRELKKDNSLCRQ